MASSLQVALLLPRVGGSFEVRTRGIGHEHVHNLRWRRPSGLATTERRSRIRSTPTPNGKVISASTGKADQETGTGSKANGVTKAEHSLVVERTPGGSSREEPLSDEGKNEDGSGLLELAETLLLISPFFFWGTAMVAMKGVLPKAGPLFVASTRLLPAGALLVLFAMWRERPLPSSAAAWFAIAVFGLVDATMFQGCLAEGLRRTSAGLGSVIIDSQPLTVALLAALLFGERIGPLGFVGLATGVLGLCLLEVPGGALESFLLSLAGGSQGSLASSSNELAAWIWNGGLWESGEWWMLLAAQSMAVGTVMVRWVTKYCDPVMATGWHMVLGGLPLLALSLWQEEPAFTGHLGDLTGVDLASLAYTSLFGSAISYGVFFHNANKGNLTRLSSLTFLTPMFAAAFGYLYLNETLNSTQLLGAATTLIGIYLVNYQFLENKGT